MKRLTTRLIALILTVAMLAGLAALPVSPTSIKTGIGVVTASSLRLRAAASTDSEILATACAGDCVVIMQEVDGWYLVNYNLQVGYMSKDYVEFNERKNVKLGYAMFDTTSNVRTGPDTASGIVAQAPKGETCFIIGFNCGWYKVSFNGQIGYVRSDLLTLLEEPYYNAGSRGNTYKESSKKTDPAASSSSSSSKDSSGSKKISNSKSSSSSSSSSSTSASASSTSSSTSSASTQSASTESTLGEQVVAYARKYMGYRYVFGGASPSTGFDCSGLVYYIYKQLGYNVGRTSANQLYGGTQVSRNNLKVGDIVLFERTYTTSDRATHSGIYIGDGNFIHAANSRLGVIVSNLSTEYYSSRFLCGIHVG